jgi:hypothetical protein
MCKDCKNAYQRKKYAENPASFLVSNKKHRDRNRGSINAKKRFKYQSDAEHRANVNRVNTRNYWESRADRLTKGRAYRIKNKSKRLADARMRKKKLRQATPPWLTGLQKKQIADMYGHAKDCFLCTGERYDVDHIVPLCGENVCGLHVPWNLQVLPSDVNRAKWNKHDAS